MKHGWIVEFKFDLEGVMSKQLVWFFRDVILFGKKAPAPLSLGVKQPCLNKLTQIAARGLFRHVFLITHVVMHL